MMKKTMRRMWHWAVAAVAIALLLSSGGAALAASPTTIPGGEVSGTWTAAGSPYLVQGDLTVPVGAQLTIEPGVEVIFQEWYKLTVNGELQALGTDADPILFSAVDKWLGIRFVNAADSSRLDHVIVEKGQATGASPDDSGGGIYIENSSPTVSASTIRDNFATKAGGGLYLSGSNATLLNNTITGNQAGQGGSAVGGGIAISSSNPRLAGNVISGNRVSISGSYSTPTGAGGGIYAIRSDLDLRYNIISNNVVQGHLNSYARGGALYLQYGNPLLVNNTITGNATTNESTGYYAVTEGDGLYVYQTDPILVNNVLWNNGPEEIFVKVAGPAQPLTVAYSDVQGGQSSIANPDGAPVNWLEGNRDADPRFVDASTGNFELQESSPAIDAGTAFFEWNGEVLVNLDAGAYEGAAPDMGALETGGGGSVNQPPVAVAAATPSSGSAPLTVQFSAEGSADPDGAITAYAWDFGDGNSATAASPTHTYDTPGAYEATLTVTDDDGASHSDVVTVTVVDGTTIRGGDVSGTWTASGSPYRIDGDITVPAGQSLTIEPGVTVLFQNWYRFTVRGTLVVDGTENDPVLFTATDSAPGWLGLRFLDAADGSRVSYAIVERGKATGASPEDTGGGIYVENSAPTIDRSIIRGNLATRAGGGIALVNADAVLRDNTIINNQAGEGGTAYGGGLYIADANPQLSGNVISGNRVSISGSYSTPTGAGGGIYAIRSDATLAYNVISNNEVQGHLNSYARGGALYLQSGNPQLISNTITGNATTNESTGDYAVTEGGGLYLSGSHPIIVNSILWNDAPEEIMLAAGGALTVAYSDVQGGQSGLVNPDGATVNWLEGNRDADPRFVDAAAGNFELQESSPAVDAGIASFAYGGTVLVDLTADQYDGNAPDMGALESPYAASSENLEPTADAGADQTVSRGADVLLDGSNSSDPDDNIASHHWEQLSGKGVKLEDAGSAVTAFRAPNGGKPEDMLLVFELTVTDEHGASASDTVTITVR